MTLPGGFFGPSGTHGPDTVLGLSRVIDAEKRLAHRGPPESGRGGGGCRRILVWIGRALLAVILLGWTLTLITRASGS